MEHQRGEGHSEQIEEDSEVPNAPVYHPKVKFAPKQPQGHQYYLHSKGPVSIPSPWVSLVRNQSVKSNQMATTTESLEWLL